MCTTVLTNGTPNPSTLVSIIIIITKRIHKCIYPQLVNLASTVPFVSINQEGEETQTINLPGADKI